MFRIEDYWHVLTAFLLIMILIGGCALARPPVPQISRSVESGVRGNEIGWWRADFQIKWPDDTEPLWYMDLFISLEIVSPVLDQYGEDIILWRFHRRAARDETGHRFSFIFYCTRDTAQQVYDSIQSNDELKKMKTAGMIIQDIYDDTGRTTQPDIEDTSDPGWSPSTRKSWPYFIMGVSRMWLEMIKDIAGKNSDRENLSSAEEFRAFYEQVNESVLDIWREEGSHAMLHHLNALFGYEPVAVYERRFMTF